MSPKDIFMYYDEQDLRNAISMQLVIFVKFEFYTHFLS